LTGVQIGNWLTGSDKQGSLYGYGSQFDLVVVVA
jgi:hypothetical protein